MELAQDHTRGWFENLKEKLGFYGSYVGEDGKRHSKRTQVVDESSDSDDESLVEAQNYQASIEHSSDEDKSSQNFNNGRPPTPPPKKIIKPGQPGYDEYQRYLASQRV